MGTLRDLLDSGMSPEEINALLSQSNVSTAGFDPMGTTGRGEPYMPPPEPQGRPGMVEQAPLNMIRNNSTGRTFAPVDQYGQPSQSQGPRDVYRDGPQVLDSRQLPDGRTVQRVRVPAMDGFGRQSSGIQERIVTPEYLNPAALAQQKFEMEKERLAQLRAKPADPEVSKQAALMRMYESIPEGPMKQAFGEKHGFSSQKSEKTTEDEKKTAYHANKMLDSINRIKEISATSKDALSPGVAEATAAATVGPYSGSANVARSGSRQAVFGLQADLIDSLLYLATGAAYNKEQLLQKKESLLPAFTDKPEAIAEKKRSLNEYMKAAKIRAGKAWTPEMEGALTSLYDDVNPATPPSSPPASVSNKKPAAGVLVPAANEQQALTLPPGTRFRLPDGRTGTAR